MPTAVESTAVEAAGSPSAASTSWSLARSAATHSAARANPSMRSTRGSRADQGQLGAAMNKKPPRRSIVSSFSAFTGPPPRRSAVIRDCSRAQVRLRAHAPLRAPDAARGRRRHRRDAAYPERHPRGARQAVAQVEAGGLVEVDPEAVDPSPLPERLPDDDASAFEALKRSLAEEGQKVPVELRRHPGSRALPARLRTPALACRAGTGPQAEGHRQRARRSGHGPGAGSRECGPAGPLLDREGSLRWRMEAAGIRARDIRAALQVDDPELARFRSVCRALGPDLIALIGRAPKAGRPRWTELAAAASAAPERLEALRERMQAEGASDGSSSDQRFARALAALRSIPSVWQARAGGGRARRPPLGGPPLARRKSRSRSRRARTGSSLFSRPNCRPSRRATARAERSSEAASEDPVPVRAGH